MKAALFCYFCLLPLVSLLFLFPSFFSGVQSSEGQAVRPAPCFLSDACLGRFLSSLLSFVRTFFLSLSLSPLADSSDKLALSSAHMALGKNQCPYVSSAALHWTDEG